MLNLVRYDLERERQHVEDERLGYERDREEIRAAELPDPGNSACSICLQRRINSAFVACGHLVSLLKFIKRCYVKNMILKLIFDM